ncbi:MAG: sulfatase-like hydrolase/transferase [Nocardioidaceae bacterium]
MAGAAKPNVVILYADDLGWGDLGCFGAEDMETPALDRLCASGVRLTQWVLGLAGVLAFTGRTPDG